MLNKTDLNTKKCIFDDIISLLKSKAESEPYTSVEPALLKRLYNHVEKNKTTEKEILPLYEKTQHISIKSATENLNIVNSPSEKKKGLMDSLRLEVSSCLKCRLHEKRTNTVLGDGSLDAELMFIGEGPGEDEDLQGLPFVGKAGQLLSKMINAMQFDRREVYIANIVKCRPPSNRPPEDDEAQSCLPYLYHQIEIVSPKIIILLGAVPLKHILGKTDISKIHGTWHEFKGIKVVPVYHPAYLLRNPSAKAPVWDALKKVMAIFGKKSS